MKAMHLLLGGALAYVLLREFGGTGFDISGGRNFGAIQDGLTGEPMAPYSGRGRPRSFNSTETKRTGVLWRELRGELDKTKTHLWRPSSMRSFASMVRSEMNTQLNEQRVCVGTMRLEGGAPACDGETMKFSKWMAREARKKREAAKKAS